MARTNFFVLLALLIALVPVVAADEAKQARIIDRLAKKQADAAQRLENLLKTLDELAGEWRPQEVAYTNPVRNQWPVPALEALDQALKTWANRHGLSLFQYAPREIRASIVGRANAPKEDLAYTVMTRWGLIGMAKSTVEWDAIAAGDYHLQCRGQRMVPQVS